MLEFRTNCITLRGTSKMKLFQHTDNSSSKVRASRLPWRTSVFSFSFQAFLVSSLRLDLTDFCALWRIFGSLICVSVGLMCSTIGVTVSTIGSKIDFRLTHCLSLSTLEANAACTLSSPFKMGDVYAVAWHSL